MKQNLPNGVMKVVSFADSGDKLVCQNPEFASSLLKLVILHWREKLMSVGADEAAVNLGHKGEVSALLRQHSLHLVDFHCYPN